MKNIITFITVAIIIYIIIAFCTWNINWVATAHWLSRVFYIAAIVAFSIPFIKH